MIYYSANLNQLTHINDFEQILQLSLILQNSQNWMVSNEPQEHIKHGTDKVLTQKKRLKRHTEKKYNLITRFL